MSDTAAPLNLEDCINQTCPWSGKAVVSEALTHYRGHVVGFCNSGCREKFARATKLFDSLLDAPQT